jgi:hypothetical protein
MAHKFEEFGRGSGKRQGIKGTSYFYVIGIFMSGLCLVSLCYIVIYSYTHLTASLPYNVKKKLYIYNLYF